MMQKTWLHKPSQDAPCTLIAEVAQAHDGSLGMAHAFIDAAAKAQADAIKFQTHIAEAESTVHEPWRTRLNTQDSTRLDYWRRMEFSETQWGELKKHAEHEGLLFISSPFSIEAVELLKRVGVAGWKIASGEITNCPMLEAVCDTGLAVILSSGMSPLAEVAKAVAQVQSHGNPLAVLQCTSLYPTPPEAVGLNVLDEFRDRFGCAVGLSDHSAVIFPGLGAAMKGAQVIEVHITLSRDAFGPDVVASLTPQEIAELVRGVRYIEAMLENPVDKSVPDEQTVSLRAIFMKSLTPARDLAKGTVLERDDLRLKKPGTGIPADAFEKVIGMRLKFDVIKDTPLTWGDLE